MEELQERQILSDTQKHLFDAISRSGAAGIRCAIKTAMNLDDKRKVPEHLIEKATALATDSGEYTMRERVDDYYIFKNPNRFVVKKHH
jgi:hypothetical protein